MGSSALGNSMRSASARVASSIASQTVGSIAYTAASMQSVTED